MTRLNNSKFNFATEADVEAFAAEATELINKYGWQERTVMPYGYPVKVTKIMNDLQDYSLCTNSSKSYLIALANGLADILEAWESHELEPKLTIRAKQTGKIMEIDAEIAKMLIEDGCAEAI